MSHPYEALYNSANDVENDFVVTAYEHEALLSLDIERDSSNQFDTLQRRAGGLEIEAKDLCKWLVRDHRYLT
jgi:hypothetical protein